MSLATNAAECATRKRIAIVTGGARGIGKGISKQLAASGTYQGLLISYNTNQQAADVFASELKAANTNLEVAVVGGDLATPEARKAIFDCYDTEFSDCDLALLVHNAGQYVGVTSNNSDGLDAEKKKFGDGSLLVPDSDEPDLSMMRYYQKLYGEGFVDLCERSAFRMKEAKERSPDYRGSIVGISSPGCNHAFKVTAGYDMPGSGKCMMEYACRLYALNLAPSGVNVNVVIPGFTRSDAWDKIAEARGSTGAAMLDMMKSATPCGEVAEATDIGDVIVFLSGSGGGRFLTGLSLRADGGLHLK